MVAAAAAPPDAPAAAGNHKVQVNGTTFEVPIHLQLIRSLGSGTYGAVAAFKDTRTDDTEVAIKKIPNPLRNVIDGKRCLREIKLLQLLDHDAVIAFLDVLPPASPYFEEVSLVTEIMDADLHTVICSEQPLSSDHVQFFIYHILRALLYMHSANVVHRDLKPLNVLVNKNCDIKLCDFGLARGRAGFSQEDDDYLRTEYVGTRWYRAPEIVLTSMEYTAAVDIWSAGCILGELIGRSPLFRGSDFLDQIRTICEVLGTPTQEELAFIPKANEAARTFIETRFSNLPRKSWATLLPDATAAQCDMLDQTLHFNPACRLTAYDLLRHEYLVDHHCDEDETVAEAHVDWVFDDASHTPNSLRCMIYHEIARLHPEIIERDREELEKLGWLVDGGPPAPPQAEPL